MVRKPTLPWPQFLYVPPKREGEILFHCCKRGPVMWEMGTRIYTKTALMKCGLSEMADNGSARMRRVMAAAVAQATRVEVLTNCDYLGLWSMWRVITLAEELGMPWMALGIRSKWIDHLESLGIDTDEWLEGRTMRLSMMEQRAVMELLKKQPRIEGIIGERCLRLLKKKRGLHLEAFMTEKAVKDLTGMRVE